MEPINASSVASSVRWLSTKQNARFGISKTVFDGFIGATADECRKDEKGVTLKLSSDMKR